jgi:hypothetical protein
MAAARPLKDVFAELTGDDAARADEVLAASGHGDLPPGLVAEAVVNYADTAPVEVAEHLAPFVTANSAVPTLDEVDGDADWSVLLATAPAVEADLDADLAPDVDAPGATDDVAPGTDDAPGTGASGTDASGTDDASVDDVDFGVGAEDASALDVAAGTDLPDGDASLDDAPVEHGPAAPDDVYDEVGAPIDLSDLSDVDSADDDGGDVDPADLDG